MGTAVVEFQAFKDNNNKFILKELAIVGKSYRTQIIFKPPYSINELNDKMQRTARWLSRHYHHIKWNDGDVEYDERILIYLCKPFKAIYTKGLEKAIFLRQFHSNVIELDQTLHINTDIKLDCLLNQHNVNNENCALKSAYYYLKYI